MLGARVFRVFISSTFSDMAAERNALQDRVFPELRSYCAARGFGFQPVDLRWGIGEEASSGHRTMRICLSEIARCQAISPRPNFIVLLGGRYGWRPLPEVIGAAEFGRLAERLASPEAAIARACYALDENAVPPEYALRPRSEVTLDWSEVEARLRPALATAAQAAGLDEPALARYRTSATEQEIVDGALDAPGAEDHVFCFVRETAGIPDDAGAFRDVGESGRPDEEAEALLAELKRRLRARLPGHVFEYAAAWDGESGAPSTGHLDRLCADVLASLRGVMEVEIDRLQAMSHQDQERAAHEAFARERSGTFVGRGAYLDAIAGYLDGSEDQPLCVFSDGGLGKSALMAASATRARMAHPAAVVVVRHIGVTPSSADLRSLLGDLCAEIGGAYGSDEPAPTSLAELVRELPRRLGMASAGHPLMIFLDSLDQLAGGIGGQVAWLPTALPPGVRLVASTRPGPELVQLRARLVEEQLLELGPMPVAEADTLLDAWLAAAGRRLQPRQRELILGRFAATGSPLYLRLATEEARRWSHTGDHPALGLDVPAVIDELYGRLEREHGPELVSHALGFLAATYERLGLSEEEMLEALAQDDETWQEFVAGTWWPLPARQLPVVVWSRLYFDLAPYISPRASEGASLLSFFHRELADAARRRYVDGRGAHLHGVLADVLGALAHERDGEPRVWTGSGHALAELPYHLTGAERWDDLFATLTDFTYLEAKARRVAVVSAIDARGRDRTAYNGVLALIDDYDRALERFPTGVAGPGEGSETADG